ncbi:FAD binding domain-containing protein [Ramlibacter tataouinensis]|uniref:4-hydroxybenzoyl-CoA reductase-like protein n=1 Tax=Ramlibacter tataouinensis (strain ATCC BAA-407 / DSM 14655 / LMG 21543 / TTB310) TaxID=365046 RepID=F5Y2B0_RAMTT|nr:xanthine dehydrogenase family protein subunit M [Ramlibacter tataouinensis]AEG91084.1 4-hydroxybenzoyl-CoA reductase-like protein [Ramlibacter tataouinensis TTB310]
MNNFSYSLAPEVDGALEQIGEGPGSTTAEGFAKFIAGGTNLLDLMKENVMRPRQLVDINRLPLAGITELPDGGLRLGATARNAHTAWHPLVRERYPLLSAAILAAASPQVRNMASNGGNLLQRTRCYYFYDSQVPCNKREPGTGCPPREGGLARQHAILGASEHCVATHPSDMAVALAALDAVVQVRSPRGGRSIPILEFHRLPGDRPDIDTTLAHDELITSIDLPPAAGFAAHSSYLKIRERASYAFALVSVAAALELEEDGRTVRTARIAVGGVAHKPWRDLAAESLLAGQPATAEAFGAAAQDVLKGAQACGEGPGSNAFKIPLARRAVVRALQMATRGILSNTGEDRA